MKDIISGVYVITNIINGKRYIGSSANVFHREAIHTVHLRKGKHHNTHLQNAYNKYGEENFRFQVLEHCPTSLLIKREQYYIDLLHPEYNARLTADSNLGLRRSESSRKKMSAARMGVVPWNKGTPHSDETRKKISESHKGSIPWNKGKTGVYTKEVLKKFSEVQKGKKLSKETRQKMSVSHKARSLLKRFLQKISES